MNTKVVVAKDEGKKEVAIFHEPRLKWVPAIEERFGVDKGMWFALVDAIYPSAKTTEGVCLALAYCKARKLDPMKRMVHVVPVWSSQLKRIVEGCWPGIGEHRTTAARTGRYAGCDETTFGPHETQTFRGKSKYRGDDGYEEKNLEATVTFPSWARVTVYKIVQGMRVAFVGPKVFWLATYGRHGNTDVPNDKWQRSSDYMLEKCAEAAALRKAFPEELGDEPTAEEMEGRIVDVTPTAPIVTEAPPPKPKREDFAGKTIEGEATPAHLGEAVDDSEAVLESLVDELAVCQTPSDIEDLLETSVLSIQSLRKDVAEKWDRAIAARRELLKKKS